MKDQIIALEQKNGKLQTQIEKLQNKILKLENKTLKQEQKIIKLETKIRNTKMQPLVVFNATHDKPRKKNL